jgi:SPP1 family predicted phage head-tail adaptor
LRMRVGNMRHRITIQTATESKDSQTGKITKVWADGDDVWGQIVPLSGRELFEAQKIKSNVSHRIRLRYFSDESLSHLNRFKYNGRIFYIHSVVNRDERNWEWETMCVEESNGSA